jgi:hypothetical protein
MPAEDPVHIIERAAQEGASSKSAYGVRRQGELRNSDRKNAAMDAAESNAFTAGPQRQQRNRHLSNALQKMSTRYSHTVLGQQIKDGEERRQMQQEQMDAENHYRGRAMDQNDRQFGARMDQQKDQFGRSLAETQAGRTQQNEQFGRTLEDRQAGRTQQNDQFGRSLAESQAGRAQQAEQFGLTRTDNREDRQDARDWRNNTYEDARTRADEQQDYDRTREAFGLEEGLMRQYTPESVQAARSANDPSLLKKNPQGPSAEQIGLMGKERNAMQDELASINEMKKPTDADLARREELAADIRRYDEAIGSSLLPKQPQSGMPPAAEVAKAFPITPENIQTGRATARELEAGVMKDAPPEVKKMFDEQVAILNDSRASDAEKSGAMYRLDQIRMQSGGRRTPREKPKQEPQGTWWERNVASRAEMVDQGGIAGAWYGRPGRD